jgi:hypothetical protein
LRVILKDWQSIYAIVMSIAGLALMFGALGVVHGGGRWRWLAIIGALGGVLLHVGLLVGAAHARGEAAESDGPGMVSVLVSCDIRRDTKRDCPNDGDRCLCPTKA